MDPANRRYDLPGLQPDRPALLPGAEVGAGVGGLHLAQAGVPAGAPAWY